VTTVQLISKPVAPPWNDATKVLVHGLVSHPERCRYRFFGTPASQVLTRPGVECEVVASAHRFQPSLGDHLRTLVRVVIGGRDVNVYHCLFTPNPRTSHSLRLVLRAKRRPIVHTLCSSPSDWAAIVPLLFADRIVTVSEWARRSLEACGVKGAVHIPPGIEPVSRDPAREERLRALHDLPAASPCLLFSGDYEYSAAHPVLLEALPEIVRHAPDAVIVFACRTKTPEAVSIEQDVRRRVEALGLTRQVRFLREVDDFDSLLSLSTIVLFPVQSLHRKMDVPLTLLQALALERPIITSTLEPLMELHERPVGLAAATGDAAALAAAVTALLADPARRAAMGRDGARFVGERYTMARMARAYEDLYISLHQTA
jgi:glycosyltransferase involved in cell wall biosynthesis